MVCFACIVASFYSILDHALGACGTGVFFTSEACCWITGALCVAILLIYDFARLVTKQVDKNFK